VIVALGKTDAAQIEPDRTVVPMLNGFAYPLVFGVSCLLMGFSAFFFHASLTFIGQTVDMSSMYLLVDFMLFYNLTRLRWINSKAFILCYVALTMVLGLMATAFPVVRRYAFAFVALAALVSEIVIMWKLGVQTQLGYLYIALASIAVAAIGWYVDNERVICFPDSWLHGHTIWHLLTPVSTGAVYLYYRSESR
jgi:hypothetical protein